MAPQLPVECPPPYEQAGRPVSQLPSENQTTPKSADMTAADERHSKELKRQIDEHNKQHSCVPSGGHRRQSRESPNAQRQFVKSLSAPKRFFSLITIEPLAFFAILALYLEFPSIQDLIYTKICLQVIEKHANDSINPTQPQTNHSPSATHRDPISLAFANNVTQPVSLNTFNPNNQSRALDNSGRIVQPTSQREDETPVLPSNSLQPDWRPSHLICDRLNKSAVPEHIRQEIVDGDSLFWLKYQVLICLLCTLSNPYWGGISDRIGRLIPLNVPIVAAVASNLISLAFGLLISMNSHASFAVEWLYLGAVLTGLSGGQAVVIVNSFSFISDNTSVESRSKRVTVLESVIYLSHSVGFYLNKHIMSLGLASPEQPWLNRHFVAFSACTLLNLLCVIYSTLKLRHHKLHRFLNNFEREQRDTFSADIFNSTSTLANSGSLGRSAGDMRAGEPASLANADRLRELTASTPDDLDGPIVRSDKSITNWRTILTFKYYAQTYETAMRPRESRTVILLLLLCGFISAMSLTSLMSLLFIYLHMDPFNWTTSQYSSWNSITSISRGIALVGLTICMKFSGIWNVPDPLVAGIGFLSKGIGMLMIATAQSSSLIQWSLVAFVLSEFSMPPIRSLLSKLVASEELGKIYSCLAAIQSVCFLVGNVVFYLAYTSLGVQRFFRQSFLVVGGFQIAAILIMFLIYGTLRRRSMIL